MYGSSSTLTGYTLLGNKPFDDYTQDQFSKMETKLMKRTIETDNGLLYPIKKGMMIPFTDQLVKQALFGKQVQDRLISSTTGLADLIKDLTEKAIKDGYVEVHGGRKIPLRHAHAALNSACQGLGAVAMKVYLRIIHTKFAEAGLQNGVHYKQQLCIYDEVDLIVRKDVVDVVTTILETSYSEVSKELNMTCTYTGEVLTGNDWHACH